MSDMPRAALVTGAAKRLGRTHALELARRGFDVAIHYGRSREEALEVVRRIEGEGRRAVALQAELTDEDQVSSLVPKAEEALGVLGVLVNSAAIFELDGPEDATKETWDRHLAVNLRAPFLLIQAFARQLPAPAEGLVVNMIDERVLKLTPRYTSYSVSKVGLWGLTCHLALALAPRIRVNGIGPGPILPSPGMSDAAFEKLCRSQPLERGATLEEVAKALGFFLDAPSVTGQLLALDGGQHLGWLPAGMSADRSH